MRRPREPSVDMDFPPERKGFSAVPIELSVVADGVRRSREPDGIERACEAPSRVVHYGLLSVG
jgi:hypothetical protein